MPGNCSSINLLSRATSLAKAVLLPSLPIVFAWLTYIWRNADAEDPAGDSQYFEAGSPATAPAEPGTLATMQRSISIPPRLTEDADPAALGPPPTGVPPVAVRCQIDDLDPKWTAAAAERQRAAAAVAPTQQAQRAQRSPQLSRRSTAEIEPRWLAPAAQDASPASAAGPPATVQRRFSIPPRLTEDIDAEVPVPASAPEPQLNGGTSLPPRISEDFADIYGAPQQPASQLSAVMERDVDEVSCPSEAGCQPSDVGQRLVEGIEPDSESSRCTPSSQPAGRYRS